MKSAWYLTEAVALFGLFFGVGWNVVVRRLPGIGSSHEALAAMVFSIGAGAVLIVPVMMFLSHIGAYRPITGFILAGSAFLALFNPALWKTLKRTMLETRPDTPLAGAALIAATILTVLALLRALMPPFAKDALIYHLAIQKTYLRAGGFVDLPYNIHSYFPQGIESLYALGMLVGGDRIPALLHAGIGVFMIAATILTARRMGASLTAAWCAAAAVAATPVVWMEQGWPYVDLGMGFFVTLAVVAFLVWQSTGSAAWLAVAGGFVGAAFTVKPSALIFWAIFFFLIALALRRNGQPAVKSVIRPLMWFFIPALVIAGPWLFRNVMLTGNPFYPFLYTLFPSRGPGWDADRAAQWQLLLKSYGSSAKTVIDYLTLPFRVCWLARYEDVSRYDAVIGGFYFVLVPLAFFWRRWSVQAKWLFFLVATFFCFWALTGQVARYLIAILPVTATLVVYGVEQVGGRIPSAAVQLGVGAVCLFALAGNVGEIGMRMRESRAVDFLSGRVTTSGLLRSMYDEIPLYEKLNAETPPTARVFLIGTGNCTYYLDRDTFSDYVFEDHSLVRLTKSTSSSAELAARIRALGISHLMVRPEILFSPDLRPPEFTAADEVRLREFFRRECRVIGSSGRLVLFELSPQTS